jgi:hypothetical protein
MHARDLSGPSLAPGHAEPERDPGESVAHLETARAQAVDDEALATA